MSFLTSSSGRRGAMWYGFIGLFVAVILVVVVGGLLFQAFTPGFMGYRYGFFPFGFFFFPFGFIILFFLIGGVLRWIFWPRGTGWGWGGGYYRRGYWGYQGDAYEILRQRYARGELSKEEFERMMSDLQRSSQQKTQ